MSKEEKTFLFKDSNLKGWMARIKFFRFIKQKVVEGIAYINMNSTKV